MRPPVALRAGAAPRHRRHRRGCSPARAWPQTRCFITMTKTYVQHSSSTTALGSAPHTGTAVQGASGLTRVPAAPMRRAMLAGAAAALALTGGAVAADGARSASPDARLIALCAGLNALQRRIGGLFAGDGRDLTDAELEADAAVAYGIDGEQRVLLDRICALTPATLAGYAAMARSLVLLRPDLAGAGPNQDLDVRLQAALVRGLAGRA